MTDLQTITVSGTTASGPRTLTYVGESFGTTYVLPFVQDRFFGSIAVRTTRSVMTADTLVDGFEKIETDLLVVAAPTPLLDLLPSAACAVLPARVHLVAYLDGPQGISASERKRQRRRVRDYAYDYEISTDDRDFDWFYDRMHVPTMAARHAHRARGESKDEARTQLFHHGMIIFVRSGGVRVAGVLCRLDPERVHARLVGWLDGDPVHLEREALKTANHFLLDWARESGLSSVDFYGCEPFLSKGTFQTKRHLGTTAVIAPGLFQEKRVAIRLPTPGRDPREFFLQNPFITVDPAGRLRARYFFDRANPPRTEISHVVRGIDGSELFDLDGA